MICAECGNFFPYRTGKKYCSVRCKVKASYRRQKLKQGLTEAQIKQRDEIRFKLLLRRVIT